ncbi:MAG TPA: TAT-variant-translocated molybdopterin oxidoreductase [Bdellovibrionota bacterium]|jgi:molybdopterin-containing oxidoreductase family iron-sulfur binding subunit
MSKKFWMTVEQAENPDEFAKNIPGEFAVSGSPVREGFEKEGLDRRDFLKVTGASALMAALAGCTRRPVQKIVPYVTNPEEIIPGQPNFYASADPATGYGLVLKTREGRPIKVDGNADHPVNKGTLSARGQAMVHDLYDPDRLRGPKVGGSDGSWDQVDAEVSKALASSKGSAWLLTGTVMSPTLKRVASEMGLRHVMVDAFSMDDVLDGQAQSYGSRVFPRYRFDKADYVLSLGADFLGTWGSTVEYTHQFSEKRKLDGNKISMNKLVMFEPVMTLTGQASDERFSVHPADMLTVAFAITHEVSKQLGRPMEELAPFSASEVAQKTGVPAEAIHSVAKELVKYKGKGLVVAKDYGAKGVALQNVANFLNSLLENEGETIDGASYPSNQFQGSHSDFEKLLNAIRTGGVKTLIISGVNPAYLFADSMKVKEALEKVPNLVYLASYADETAELAKYVGAESHSFEAWGDVSAQKDLYSIQQPTIRPLWNSRSLLECLVTWGASSRGKDFSPSEEAYKELTKTWKELHGRHGGGKGFQDWWDEQLMGGVLEGGNREGKSQSRSYRQEMLRAAVASSRSVSNKGGEAEFSLVLTPSVAIGDGSQSNNAVLQELPDPVSKSTWGNYLAVSPVTAAKLGWNDGDFVKVETSVSSAELAVYKQPGLREGVVSAHLGYGRKFNGRVGNGVGVSFVNFTGSSSTGMGTRPTHLVGVRVSRTRGSERIPNTQTHHSLEGREIVFDTTLEEYRKNPKAGIVREFKEGEGPANIWSGFEYNGYKWGMVIDLNSCTGCSACVVACSVENNVPSVGKDQVQKNREMQWLRIDRYYSGDPANPETIQQPMLCQHCDNAPCETVCPVVATVHNDEGLNQMIYNRCVGTKYCSNNCPYKVRRFNWFNNNGNMNGTLEHPIPLMMNPEVTLRSRGVMEKCTFCVQRIEAGKSLAKSQGRRAGDGDIRTACQDACSADAIVFGDTNNPESKVSKLRSHPRGFVTLEEVNAKPQITYLTKVRNRAPEGGEGKQGEHHG